ncbi:MAG TPA: Stk1 family PASTA domain-containing Ser/Thr kinase [Candidatus Dormibacteraeota bacterium]|nr:Stk1 family PASTA domain-containing Ser/Thr kinase [Candidatus Dormibacteraeota bacterium]
MQESQQTVFNQRYRLGARLGEGGMAVVYEGTDIVLRRPVAIKVLREQYASDQEFVQRFYREAQSAASLSHPNIVNVYDVGQEGSAYYIVMELVDGTTLAEMIAGDGHLPEAAAIDYAAQICAGLAYAHRHGFLHRDIKPANVLVTKDDIVKISDFGIARAVSQQTMAVTQPGMVMGSVSYLSPEQAQGHELTQASDLYSVGVMLFQMVTGHLPYEGDSPVAVALKHVNQPIPQIPESEASPALAAVIRKLLQKDPSARFQSAHETATALRAALERPNKAAVPGAHADTSYPFPGVDPRVPPPRPRRAATAEETDEEERDDERQPRKRGVVGWLLAIVLVAAATAVGWYLVAGVGFGPPVAVPDVTNAIDTQAEQALTSAGFNVRVQQEASDTVPSSHVIRTDPAPEVQAPKGSSVVVYVSSGLPAIAVPDVVGYTVSDATRLLANAKLKAKVAGSRYDEKIPPESVVEQRPVAGANAHDGDVIALVASKGPAPTTVPSVVGMTVGDAQNALSSAGFSLNVLSRQASDAIPADTIISQDPGPRAKAQKGAVINVVVSTGAPPASVPNLVGGTLDQAQSALQQAGLQSTVQYSIQQSSPAGSVVGQQPGPGQTVTKGSTVTLLLAVPGVVPDVSGMTPDQARARLSAAGYTVGAITSAPQGQPGLVVRTDPPQDTELSPGQSVNLIVGAPAGASTPPQ